MIGYDELSDISSQLRTNLILNNWKNPQNLLINLLWFEFKLELIMKDALAKRKWVFVPLQFASQNTKNK